MDPVSSKQSAQPTLDQFDVLFPESRKQVDHSVDPKVAAALAKLPPELLASLGPLVPSLGLTVPPETLLSFRQQAPGVQSSTRDAALRSLYQAK